MYATILTWDKADKPDQKINYNVWTLAQTGTTSLIVHEYISRSRKSKNMEKNMFHHYQTSTINTDSTTNSK